MFSKDEAAVNSSVPESTTQLVPPCEGQAACLAASVQLVPKMIASSVLRPLTSMENHSHQS